jgi:putative transposase
MQAWLRETKINPPRPVRNVTDLRELVGATETRKASRKGIKIFGLTYRSDEFTHMRNGWVKDKWVKVKYDPGDIEHLLVIEEETRRDH